MALTAAGLALALTVLTALTALPITTTAGATAAGVRVAGAPAGRTDAPRTGYPIRSDGTAAGGWIGSRRLGREVVYRIDPGRAPVATRFRQERWVARLDGSGPRQVTRGSTRRAAWLVAKYGTYRSPAQSAAVEVALDTLLYGGRHALRGRRTQWRVRQTGAEAAVLPLAEYMLRASARLAGPYRIRVERTAAVVDEPTGFTVRVVAARSGEPIAHLPVSVRFGGGIRTRDTDSTGTVRAGLTAGRPGPQPVQVLIRRLPPGRLLVRRPLRAGAARVVVAGRKVDAVRGATVAVRARPTVAVQAPATLRLPDPLPATLWVTAGYPSPREATLTLHGPFPDRAGATCTGPTESPVTVRVSADAGYPAPVLRAGAEGFYRWSAAVSGNAFNLPATACGDPVVVKAVPHLTVRASPDGIARGGRARARVVVRGLPAEYAGDVAVRLFGPFSARSGVRCADGRLVRRRAVAVTGPRDQGTIGAVTLRAAGFYAWQAVLPSGRLSTREVTPCGESGATVRVG